MKIKKIGFLILNLNSLLRQGENNMIEYKTQFTEKTGVKYPLIMGAFAGLGKASFAAPFSESGGLGIITAHNFRNVKRFKKELDKMSSLTSKPFGVNRASMSNDDGSRTLRLQRHVSL